MTDLEKESEDIAYHSNFNHKIMVYKVGIMRKAYACACGITVYSMSFPHSQLKQLHIAQEMELNRWMNKMLNSRYENLGE